MAGLSLQLIKPQHSCELTSISQKRYYTSGDDLTFVTFRRLHLNLKGESTCANSEREVTCDLREE